MISNWGGVISSTDSNVGGYIHPPINQYQMGLCITIIVDNINYVAIMDINLATWKIQLYSDPPLPLELPAPLSVTYPTSGAAVYFSPPTEIYLARGVISKPLTIDENYWVITTLFIVMVFYLYN